MRLALVTEIPVAPIPVALLLLKQGLGAEMPSYRLYATDKDGHIVGPSTVITCDSDQDAIQKAGQLKNGHAIEVWEGARFVSRTPSADAA